jgi:hypothetical protein
MRKLFEDFNFKNTHKISGYVNELENTIKIKQAVIEASAENIIEKAERIKELEEQNEYNDKMFAKTIDKIIGLEECVKKLKEQNEEMLDYFIQSYKCKLKYVEYICSECKYNDCDFIEEKMIEKITGKSITEVLEDENM